jgi:ribosomal protein L40E
VIVCKKCGNQNPDSETFCTSCHSFLEWSGEKIVQPPPAPPPPPPVADDQPAFVERVKQAVGLDKPRTETTASSSPPAEPSAAPIAASGQRAVEAAPRPVAPSATPPPVPLAAPAAQIPAAVLPQAVAPAPERPRQPPKTDATTGQRYKPGDLICGNCGAGNSPERHFCQRCGANLTAAAIVKTPWYRKLLPARRAAVAGTRPKGAPVERAWGGALFRLIALGVIVAIVLAYFVIPPLHTRVNSTVNSVYAAAHRHFAPSTSYVRPSDAKASSQLTTHPARLAMDLIKETYWAANTTTDKQPWIRLSFGSPVDIDGILLTSGAGNDYATLARPKDVQLIFSDKTSAMLTLKDDPNPITYDVPAHGVTYVEIHILSVYPSAQSPDVAINEVEFFRIQ